MINLEELLELIPLRPVRSVDLSGIGHAVMIQFHTFYIRVEIGSTGDTTYHVSVYRYSKSQPMYIDEVDVSQLQSYFRQYTSEEAVDAGLIPWNNRVKPKQ